MIAPLLMRNRLLSKPIVFLTCLLLPALCFAQNKVSGTVKDEAGAALANVSVVIKKSFKGTTTNASGQFVIAASPKDVLVFSSTGYATQEVTVSDLTSIEVTMTLSANALNEVVVVGYGTQKKANLTGAVGTVSSERLENRPIVDAGQGLQGVLPGLNVNIRNGDPTTAPEFNIRGFTSINGGTPLILVDGVPMALQLLNPDDIASVTVLKDAAAAAIYGARAAFGVILVETKKGKKTGKVNIMLSAEQSLAKPIFLMDVVTDPYEFVTAYNQASIRSTGQPAYDDDYVQGTKNWSENPTFENAWKVYKGTLRFYGFNDYQNKLVTDFAPQQQYDFAVSGASEKVNYYASFGFLNKDGYLRPANNENFKRYNILSKAEIKVTDWLSLDEKIVFNSQVSDKPHFYNWDVNINSSARQNPIAPIQFPDLPYYLEEGDRDQFAQYIGKYFGGTNFFPYLLDGGRETFTNNDLWLTQGVTLTPLKGLKIRGDFSYNQYNRSYQDVASKVEIVSTDLTATPMITNGYSGDDFINNRNDYNQYFVLNAYAEYTMDQFKDHSIKAMIGFNEEWGRNSYIRAQAKSLITPGIPDLNATSGTQQTWGGKSHVALQGYFYRLNYAFKDRYLLETNGRYDGTSRFPKDSRFGFFPSVSVGWRISKERFMERTNNWLDNLKLRASYGTLGNQILKDEDGREIYYPYIVTMGTGAAPYIMGSGYIPYVSPAGLVSPTLTWETVVARNIGLDFTVLDQRLDISFDLYSRDTKDMLMNVSYPDILGTTAPKSNAANLRTKGWELSASWRDKAGKSWTYGVTLALSDNTSKITKYGNPSGAIDDYYVGKDIGTIWAYETVGIFQTNEAVAAAPDQSQLGAAWKAGDMQYADLNKDGKITPGKRTLDDYGDLKIVGNTTPRYSFGLNGDVSFKGLSLNVFFQGIMKRDYLPKNDNWQAFYPFNTGYIEKYFITESWSETNRDAYFAAPTFGFNSKKNIQPQSRYVQNAAYIRLKNITLSYDLPSKWMEKVKLTRAQVYFAGMNLWEYTKMHKPLDPESVYTLTQEYYLQRILTLGAKLTF
ncbi:MAG: SusC/RagA family TonB-linked outer membrane protein [Agriterribacter sp.]